MRQRIGSLLGKPPAELLERPLTVNAVVAVSGPNATLHLSTRHGETEGHRRLEGASCEEVSEAASLIIALAIDPSRGRESDAPVARFDPPDDVDGARAEPAKAESGPNPNASTRPAANDPRPGRAMGGRRPAPGSPPSLPLRVSVVGAVLLDTAALPGASAGAGLGGGIRGTAWRADVLASFFPFRHAPSTVEPDKGGDIALLSANLRGCWLALQGPVEGGPCVGAESGALFAEGVGLRDARTDTEPWLALELGGTLAFGTESLQLGLNAGLLAPLGRPTFGFTRSDGSRSTLHRPGALGARASLGLRLSF